MKEKFQGFERLIGKEAFAKMQATSFCVIGLGGVGSWAAEALIRSGVIKLKIVDYDEICVSNFNRQIHAIDSNLGKSKVKALKERLLTINKHAEIEGIEDFYSKETRESILANTQIVIDAIDSLSAKCELIVSTKEKNISCIVVGGAGGKKDPLRIKSADLSQTKNDPLLQKLRKKLRRDFHFPRGKKKFAISAVFSDEVIEWDENNDRPEGTIDCSNGFGTASYITANFGFCASFLAIQEALKT